MLNIKGISAYAVPRGIFRARLARVFDEILRLDDATLQRVRERVNYYNKISHDFSGVFGKNPPENVAQNSPQNPVATKQNPAQNPAATAPNSNLPAQPLQSAQSAPAQSAPRENLTPRELQILKNRTPNREKLNKFPFHRTEHYFDSYELTKYFNDDFEWFHKFGDVADHLLVPAICKSRLIGGANENNVILKLDKDRHFCFIKDKFKFEDKKPQAVWRGAAYQQNRIDFLRAYAGAEFADIADTRKDGGYGGEGAGSGAKNALKNALFRRANFLSKSAQMGFRYIIALEGNDVASNLKWAMGSNSLVICQSMRCETWFMEGRLRAGEHFALCDNENLGEVVAYYNAHVGEAREIVARAHEYVAEFLDERMEFFVGILVLAKYFYFSGQMELPRGILEIVAG